MMSGRVRGVGRNEGLVLWASMASGLADMDVFVGGMEVTDTRLPREELLEMADGVPERGVMAAMPSSFRDTGWRDGGRVGKPKSPSCPGDGRAAPIVVVVRGKKAISLALVDWDPTWLQGGEQCEQ
jgi:hypothetical protein